LPKRKKAVFQDARATPFHYALRLHLHNASSHYRPYIRFSSRAPPWRVFAARRLAICPPFRYPNIAESVVFPFPERGQTNRCPLRLYLS